MRGSPHVHGILWMRNAPDVKFLEEKCDELKHAIIEFLDKIICCETPNINFVDVGVHPSSVKILDVIDEKEDLAALINNVQMHTCSNKCTNNGKSSCKYGFPKMLREVSDLVMNKRKYYEYEGKRNHPDINKFGELFLKCTRSNGDVTGVLSDSGFKQYLSKYVSKGEVKSLPLLEILTNVLHAATNNSSVKSSVQKSLMAALVQRDYSAQEVHHLLSGKKLYSCSRIFVKLNLKDTQWKYHVDLDESGEIKDNCNHIFHSYSKRPKSLEKVCLLKFMQLYNTQNYGVRRRSAVVVVYPRLKLAGDESDEQEVARQLVLLYVPWRDLEGISHDARGWVNIKLEHNLDATHLPYYSAAKALEPSSETDDEPDETEYV